MAGKDSSLVLVTGASGFLGCHCVQQLLRADYRVRATVRSLKNAKKTQPLKNLCPEKSKNLELVEADLEKPESWAKAVQNVDFILHTASPFPVPGTVQSPEKLLRVTRDGVLNVLKAAHGTTSVKRLVLTSSFLAVCRGHGSERGNKAFTEEDWTHVEAAGILPYEKAKTLAEKAAWEFMETKKPKFELVALCPALMLGPLLHNSDCTSAELVVKRLMSGQATSIPQLFQEQMDVRDAAKGHMMALSAPKIAGKRVIMVNKVHPLEETAKALEKEFIKQGYRVPTRVAYFFELWIQSFFDTNLQRILPRVGVKMEIDTNRMRKDLGLKEDLIDPNKSAVDMAYSLIDKGFLPKTRLYKPRNKP